MEEKSSITISKKSLVNYALLLLAIAILAVSVVQAYQLASINGGSVKATGSESSAASLPGQTVAQNAVVTQQAPAMVGGC